MEADRLYYDDAIAIAYLYLKIYGTNKYKNIKQVVIDEAQTTTLSNMKYRLIFLMPNLLFYRDMKQTCQKRRYFSTNKFKNIEQENLLLLCWIKVC